MTINERIAYIRKILYEDNNVKFAKALGVATQYASNICKNGKSVGERQKQHILEVIPNLNRVWLLTGEGNMLNYNNDNSVACEQKLSYNKEEKNSIIRYWIDIQATGGGLISFDDIRETYRKIDIKIPEFSDCTDAINLYGDSMAPQYKSGQIIILKEWKETFIDYGNAYLIITKNGNRMVKVLRTIKDDEKNVLCVSYNPDFDAFKLKKEDILRLYLVKGAIEKTTL